VSDPVPVTIQIRRIKPVKVSTLHAKAERYRDGFVKLFREHEHADVLNEDGTLMVDGAGRRVSVTASWFAREMGIPKQTFHQWLNGRSVRNADSSPQDEEGWDLPGVPDEVRDAMRSHVEHNERLLNNREWRAENGMAPLEDEDGLPPVVLRTFLSLIKDIHAKHLAPKDFKLLDAIVEEIARINDELEAGKALAAAT
jgi:hypothetical protein